MTVTIRKSDTPEQMERKIARAIRAHRKQASDKGFDPYAFLGKMKDIFGDGVEYQRMLRDEWS